MNDIKVSVLCTVYNHAPFLRACLDGFVMQNCNFKYEVIIHDDASTDGSADIIREYEAKYPDIFVPIYQTENQYSKEGRIAQRFMYPKIRGKYVAYCEGDDCWIHPEKLQKQVDFLESHPDFSACVHCAKCNNLSSGKTFIYPSIKESLEYTAEEVVLNRAHHYAHCSLLGKTEILTNIPDCFTVRGAGDYQKYMYSAFSGRFWCMKEVMSQYNSGTPTSWTVRIWNKPEKRIEHLTQMMDMLKRVDAYFEFKHTNALSHVIKEYEVEIAFLTKDKSILKNPDYKPFVNRHRFSLLTQKIYRVLPFTQGIAQKFPALKIIKKKIFGK